MRVKFACSMLAEKQLCVVAGDLVKGVSKTVDRTTSTLSQVALDHKTDQYHLREMKLCQCEALGANPTPWFIIPAYIRVQLTRTAALQRTLPGYC